MPSVDNRGRMLEKKWLLCNWGDAAPSETFVLAVEALMEAAAEGTLLRPPASLIQLLVVSRRLLQVSSLTSVPLVAVSITKVLLRCCLLNDIQARLLLVQVPLNLSLHT